MDVKGTLQISKHCQHTAYHKNYFGIVEMVDRQKATFWKGYSNNTYVMGNQSALASQLQKLNAGKLT